MDINTLKILEKICEITETIFGIYESLFILDKDGKKNTKAYQDMLDYLYLTALEEDNLYQYFDIYPEEAIKALDYLLNASDKDLQGIIMVVVNNDKQEIIQARIIDRLTTLAGRNIEFYKYFVNEDLIDLLKNVPNNLEYLKNVMSAFEIEHNRRLEYFLLKESHKNDYYLNTFYMIPFICNINEKELIKDGFKNVKCTFNKNINIESKEDENVLLKLKQQYGLTIVLENIDNLLLYFDEDLEDDKYSFEFDYLLFNLEIGILFLNEKELKVIIDVYNDKINNEDYLEEHEDDLNIRNAIQNVFDNYQNIIIEANKDDYEKKLKI